jgi:hypothetical protein
MTAGEATAHLALHRTLSREIGNYQRGVNRNNQRVTHILFCDSAADFLIGVDPSCVGSTSLSPSSRHSSIASPDGLRVPHARSIPTHSARALFIPLL